MPHGWLHAPIDDIPPVKEGWPTTWKSIRHYFGITAFGINAVTKDAGEVLIPEHDETAGNQQEVYFVHRGAVRATLDGEQIDLREGEAVAIEPHVKRQLEATASPTTLLVVGGPIGRAYEVGDWEK
jgi:quercetin dioxygenase-like cupin family protein